MKTTTRSVPSTSGWKAHLHLGFQHRNQRTVLEHCTHQGPLRVQRPFYPEGHAICHIALLHPPGGVVSGDELHIIAELATNTHALITTPAAGKFYRSAGATAQQNQRLLVAANATLEWLPQENIVYDGARVQALTRVELHGDARFLGWEIVCLGRPAAGESFTSGAYQQDFELWRDGEPLYWERGGYSGGTPVLAALWGLQGQPVFATLLCTGSSPGALTAIRDCWAQAQTTAPVGESTAISQLDGVLIGRYLGPSAPRARALFIRAWSLLRPLVWQRPPCPSRFWNT